MQDSILDKYNQLHYHKEKDASKEDEWDALYLLTEPADINPDVDMAWEKVKTRIFEKNQPTKTFSLNPWMRWAAILLIAVGVGFMIQTLRISDSSRVNFQTAALEETLVLPEGSVITLAPHSSVTFSETEQNRSLDFSGKAYFNISKSRKPFTIHLQNSNVQVLGTSFTISDTKDKVTVYVEEGRVAFSTKHSKATLLPGFESILEKSTGKISVTSTGDVNQLAWVRKEFHFQDQTLGQVLETLQDHYAVQISLENLSSEKCTVTGKFPTGSLPDILNSIASVLELTIELSENQYLIRGKGC